VSAKQKLFPSHYRGLVLLCVLLAFLFACIPIPVRADSLEDAVRSLARKVTTSNRGASASIEKENRSGLTEKAVSVLCSAFEDELRLRGVKILPQTAPTRIFLTFSENPSGYLAIVRLRRGEVSESWIEALGNPQGAATLPGNAGLTLQRELVFTSVQPILDLVFSEEDPKELQVLGPAQITWYRREGDHWIPGNMLKLPRSAPILRDSRGRLGFGLDVMSAVFPNEICNMSIHDGDHCHPNKGNVDLSDVPSALLEDVEEKEFSSWLAAAQMQSEGKPVLLVTGKDGRTRIYGNDAEPIATFSNFGDQVASIQSDCGSGWQALLTLKEDYSKSDSVQGFEIRDQKPIAVTQTLQFAGPVRALRRASRSFASRPSSVIAIILNLQTGRYEAYRLSITCVN
jgi:hypothetical protein